MFPITCAVIDNYIPILLLLLVSAALVAVILLLSYLVGPGRQGPIKSIPYESGVDPIGTARSRFHARFYLIAVLFLLFDVELIFFYPFAVLFGQNRLGIYLVEILVFTAILLVALIYAWQKKIFDWR
ncbi:MAG: NADH-quinone oxidoreductase subunit A [Sedimentisphaerales bacterium]|nr:NADH-quinone oxidoreductase subunit A [Sedimentisphaerales bacterium]